MLLSPSSALPESGCHQELLPSLPDEAFNRLTRLASELLQAPMALVTLAWLDRQTFAGRNGTPESLPEQPASLDWFFSRRIVGSGKPLVLDDVRHDPLMQSDAAVGEFGVLACAGVPLVAPDGQILGTLCVFDTQPRQWSARDVSLLLDIAAGVITELELRQQRAERRNVERSLAQFGTVIEHAPAFIAWARGRNHVIEGANQAYYQLIGARDLIGRPVAEAIPEAVEQGLLAALDRVLETGEPFVAEGMRLFLRRTPGGEPEERFANFVYQAIVEPDGTRSGILCHGVDVTAQVRAATAMRESETHYRSLLDSLPVIVYQLEATAPHRPIYLNRAVESLGFTREEWLAQPDMWESRLHPEDRTRARRQARESQNAALPMDSQYRLIAKDGSVRWFHDRGEFVPDRTGEQMVWEGILLDITSEREALDALRESEARTRMLVETAHEGIWLVDAVGRTTWVNPRMCEMLGYSADDLQGRSFFDFLTPDSAFSARTLFARRQRGISEIHEYTLVRRDGSELFVLTSASPRLSDSGEFEGVLAMVTDITTRRRAEEALRESEARYRHVVANAPGVVYQFAYRPDGTKGYTFVSEGARTLLGVSPEEALADSEALLSVVPPEDRQRLRDEALAAARQLSPFHWEGRVVLPSGEERFVEVVARDQRKPDGTVLSDGLILDVTERQRALKRLEESEVRFRLAARATNDVVYDWKMTTKEHFWSDALLPAFGYDPRSIVATSAWWSERIHPDDASRVAASLAGALAGTATAWQEEYRFRRSDGTWAHVLDRGYLVRDEAGAAVRLVGSMIDLSRHMALEEQLRQAQKMEAIGRLAGGIAHDFNNLITVIRGSTSFLLDDMDTVDARRDDVRSIADASDRAAALTRQLLAFSRKQILSPRLLSLNDVVQNLQPMLARLIGEDVSVVTQLGAATGSVMADVGQLEQVLINLAVNARDAMPEGGRLTIETADVSLSDRYAAGHAARDQSAVLPGDYVMLAVSDTGVGMSADIRTRVFEPFFTTKEAGKGTGLGLSTVYGIVKQSGGHVWVYSEPGEGTVFKLYFPRLASTATRLLNQAAETAPARGSETVLLVEDEEPVRRLARRILERQGYTVLESRNGREALERATTYEGEIHLVLTDVVMPELSGRGLVERLRAVRPRAAVIYMSGYTDDDVLRRGLFEPGSSFVQKPFTPDGLLRAVRDRLDQR